MSDVFSQLPNAIRTARAGSGEVVEILSYSLPPDNTNEAVFFLKPELCSDERVDLPSICSFIKKSFQKFAVEVVGARVLPGQHLKDNNVMATHYGIINLISRQGVSALPSDAVEKLKRTFPQEMAIAAPVLGGHQFLEKYPFFSEESLSILWDTKNSQSTKIATGAYALSFQIFQEHVIILNGFHPYQLKFFTGPARCIACLIVRSDQPWSALRGRMIGATNPQEAQPDSIRRALLDHKEAWRLSVIDKGLNGVHLSAGPVEGFFEIERFFGDANGFSTQNTNFGHAASKGHISPTRLDQCRANPLVRANENVGTLFDLTEDRDMDFAVRLIAASAI